MALHAALLSFSPCIIALLRRPVLIPLCESRVDSLDVNLTFVSVTVSQYAHHTSNLLVGKQFARQPAVITLSPPVQHSRSRLRSDQITRSPYNSHLTL